MGTCTVDDCGRPAYRQGLCQGHLKRLQRGLCIKPLLGDLTWDRLHEAVLSYADAETDEEHAARLVLLKEAARKWVSAGCPGCASTTRGRMAT